MTSGCDYVQQNRMHSRQLHDALEKLTEAIREVEAVVETMRAEHDPLASHIFVSRRHYRNLSDTKSAVKLANRLRTGFSWEVGRMGAVDGRGDEAVALTRRKRRPEYAVWEIHPAMKLTVQ